MKKTQKNKFLLTILIFFPLICRAAITKEQFLALDEEKKWDLYVGHNACYQRIFKSKNEEIARLEELYASSQKWQNLAVGHFLSRLPVSSSRPELSMLLLLIRVH